MAVQKYYKGPRECINHILKTSGPAGLYKGMGSMAARDIPGYGIYLVIFEYLDHLLHRHGLTDSQVRTLASKMN